MKIRRTVVSQSCDERTNGRTDEAKIIGPFVLRTGTKKNILTDIQTDKQTDKRTYEHTDKRIDNKHTDKQANKYTNNRNKLSITLFHV